MKKGGPMPFQLVFLDWVSHKELAARRPWGSKAMFLSGVLEVLCIYELCIEFDSSAPWINPFLWNSCIKQTLKCFLPKSPVVKRLQCILGVMWPPVAVCLAVTRTFGSAGSDRGQAGAVVPCYAVLYLTLTIVDQMPASWSQQTKKI